MSEYDALLAAICSDPDEDTLRLAFADWLDEHDEPERAAFVRAQVELARTPPWEPFAVYCKWRRPDWATGAAFRHTLPAVNRSHFEWPPEAFRRGLPWRIHVYSMYVFPELEARLLAAAPVGEMHLWSGTLDDWNRFATSPVLRQLRRVHFAANPIEPLRALRDRPEALGISDLVFDRASGAGMPEVLEDLFASPLGQVVSGLHFRTGYESLDLLLYMLGSARKLERLSFDNMGLTADHIHRLSATGALQNLTELNLRSWPLGSDGIEALASELPAGLQDLSCADLKVQADGVEALALADRLAGLRRLDLSKNPLPPRAMKLLRQSRALPGLRSLILAKCRLSEKSIRHLTHSKFWPNLVEVDLHGNSLSELGVRHLLESPIPPDLTAMVLDQDHLGMESKNELRRKYGERVVFVQSE